MKSVRFAERSLTKKDDANEIKKKFKSLFWMIPVAVALVTAIVAGSFFAFQNSKGNESYSETVAEKVVKKYSQSEIEAAFLRMDYSIIAASILSVDKNATFCICDADNDGVEEFFVNSVYDKEFYNQLSFAFDPNYSKRSEIQINAGNSAGTKIFKSEKYGVVLDSSTTYYPEMESKYYKWTNEGWEEILSFTLNVEDDEYEKYKPQVDELELNDFTERGFTVCSNYFEALNAEEIMSGYAERLLLLQYDGLKCIYGITSGDFDDDNLSEDVVYFGECFSTWFENINSHDFPAQFDKTKVYTSDTFSAFLYIDSCENGLLATVFNLSRKLDVSSDYDIECSNGMITFMTGYDTAGRATVSEYFAVADVKDYNNKTDDFISDMAKIQTRILSDLGYTDIRFCLADVCETEGKEILLAGKLNGKYYFSVYYIYNGRPAEIFSNLGDKAYFLYSSDGSDRLLSFSQNQYNIYGNYTQNYSYCLFYFDKQFTMHKDDSASISVPINSTPGGNENQFFEKFNKYKDFVTVCVDPYELTGYDLMNSDPKTEEEYLKIINCNTSKSGTVNVNTDSWLNFREGPGVSYNRILIDASDSESFVMQMKGSAVSVLDTVNTWDKENPIWVKIQIKYADKVLIGYSSQRYIELSDIKVLSVGENFKIEVETSNKNLTWSVNDTDKAGIDPLTGEVTAKATGLIMVTVKSDSGLNDTCLININ